MTAAAPEWESGKVTTNKGPGGGDGQGDRSVQVMTSLNQEKVAERRVMLWQASEA